MKVWIVMTDNGDVEHMEVLDRIPRWDWEAQGQQVYEAEVNGGDSNLVVMPAENLGR